jgi:hypothetical protein
MSPNSEDALPDSLFWKSTAYRTDLYSISQILSGKVAHIEENADCFWKPKKVSFFTIFKVIAEIASFWDLQICTVFKRICKKEIGAGVL